MNQISIVQNNCHIQSIGQVEKAKTSSSFGETKSKISAEAAQIEKGTGSADNMDSFEKYKAYINSLLLGFSQNSDRESEIFVDIPDECLLAMKNDKEYESWVLKTIQKAYVYSSCSGYNTYTSLKFGKTKEEFSQESYSFPDRKTQERLRKLIQEEREAQKKKQKKLLEKKLLEQKWQKQAYHTAYVQLKILDHRMQLNEEYKNSLKGKTFHKADHNTSLHAAAKRKASVYESNFLYSK